MNYVGSLTGATYQSASAWCWNVTLHDAHVVHTPTKTLQQSFMGMMSRDSWRHGLPDFPRFTCTSLFSTCLSIHPSIRLRSWGCPIWQDPIFSGLRALPQRCHLLEHVWTSHARDKFNKWTVSRESHGGSHRVVVLVPISSHQLCVSVLERVYDIYNFDPAPKWINRQPICIISWIG